MGRVVKVQYRLEIKCISGNRYTPSAWRVRGQFGNHGDGKPTAENIDKWVTAFEQSMIDGVNKHLGIDQVVEAKIVHQTSSETVASWIRSEWRKNQPLFQII